jgi:hypothetical protein
MLIIKKGCLNYQTAFLLTIGLSFPIFPYQEFIGFGNIGNLHINCIVFHHISGE